jgi:Uncharacterised protein family UPF0047
MPAHIRAALTGVTLSIPLIEGRLALGTWQGIYLFEHRRAPHRREIAAHAIGETFLPEQRASAFAPRVEFSSGSRSTGRRT